MSERSSGANGLLSFFKCERKIACERQIACSRQPKTPVFVGEGKGGYKVVEKVVWVGEGKGSVDVDNPDEMDGTSCCNQSCCWRVFYYLLFFCLLSCLLIGIGGLVPAALGIKISGNSLFLRHNNNNNAKDRKTSDVLSIGKTYDCDAGYSKLLGLDWSDDKKEWCCEHHDRGCPLRAAPLASTDAKPDALVGRAELQPPPPATDDARTLVDDNSKKLKAWNAALEKLKKKTDAERASQGASSGTDDIRPALSSSTFKSWSEADKQMEDDLVRQIVQKGAVKALRSQA